MAFHVWTLFCSLSLSSSCKNEQLYIATGQVLRDRRSTEPVSGGEWASSRRRDGGCCKIWNRRCTNHMGAVAFQFGQISRTFFLNITKTNYPGPWCMFLLLWKTIKLYKWFMPFHAAIFSLWISKVPPPQPPPTPPCLKQWHLCSENLLDAFPVNPLTMFLYKHVFEITRKKQISLLTSSERLGWAELRSRACDDHNCRDFCGSAGERESGAAARRAVGAGPSQARLIFDYNLFVGLFVFFLGCRLVFTGSSLSWLRIEVHPEPEEAEIWNQTLPQLLDYRPG